ncbi:MAG: ammonium transporter [Symploca sp. SIO2E9]|nr:ammonium transporter [Symploca sp. SIO2E9]
MRNLKKLKPKKNWLLPSWKFCWPLVITILLVWSQAALAQEGDLDKKLDTIWVIFTACLVFFMNAGFGMLEAGFCRRQNAANILTKNLVVFCLATVAFWICGFVFMMGDSQLDLKIDGSEYTFLGTNGFLLSEQGFSDYEKTITIPIKAAFFFQLVFAGTAATIVSGAVAERIKLKAFCWFSFFFVAISYPITGHWVWANHGWLKELGFHDFAGSTVVHAVGGMAALIGARLLGPRKYFENGQIVSRYKEDGKRVHTYPHNLSIATLGCFILWLGWFGFNGGSTLSANPEKITHIMLTTNIAAATAALTAASTTSILKIYRKKPELSMIINGVLGGLVSITASSAYVELWAAAIIGFVAGGLVVFLVDRFNKWEIDDPVGAISVHLGCGIWGTLAVGLFSSKDKLCTDSEGTLFGLCGSVWEGQLFQFAVQLVGISAVLAFTFISSHLIWFGFKKVIKENIRVDENNEIRVNEHNEIKGLDYTVNGIEDAYYGFKNEH